MQETKHKILTSAERLFANKGYIGASIRDISKDSDVNIAAINYHFQSKENLFFLIEKPRSAKILYISLLETLKPVIF